jgi:hypothetical protein
MQDGDAPAARRNGSHPGLDPDFRIEPLPWPAPGIGARTARRPHGHGCVACGAEFLCSGPEETGYCAPVCPACYWIELGSQLRVYRTVTEALERKRYRIERRVGQEECRAARARRRKFHVAQGMIAGLGTLLLQAGPFSGKERKN